MPRSPEEAEKSADKLKLEGDARAAFVSRLTAGYVPPAATPAAPNVEAPAPVEKVEPKVEPKAATQPKPKYSALGETRPKTSLPPDGPVLGPEPPPDPVTTGPQEPPPFGPVPRYGSLAPGMRMVPITNEELGESPTLSNEALGESQQPPPRTGPGRPGDAPRYVVPAQMADVRMGDKAVYKREAPKGDTYFRTVPEAPNLGESEVEVPLPPAPAPTDTFRADYDFLLSRGYPRETLDEVLATEGAKGVTDRATYWRSR